MVVTTLSSAGLRQIGAALFLLAAALPATAQTLPWEVWKDLRSMAVSRPGEQFALRSSHCLDGCRFDRHSASDPRFLRIVDGEGVVFEERGPGAVVRIWMTAGQNAVSVPLDPATRVRFYFDGEVTPRIDLPLPSLFDGSADPFTAPLVGDRLVSSGGNFSYVPMPFAESLRITFAGDLTQRIWFQFGFLTVAPGTDVTSFTGSEDLSGLRSVLAAPGDPWPPGGTVVKTSATLQPGVPAVLWSRAGPGTLEELRFALPAVDLSRVRLRLTFDGRTTVDLPLADFFAAWGGAPIDGLWLESDGANEWASYFPMPFEDSAVIGLIVGEGGTGVPVEARVRFDASPPPAGSGLFGAQLQVANPSTPGVDVELLTEDRPGRWVGLAASLSSVATLEREYLEGDERIYLDGSAHPTIYGTGTEDIFNAGFYFDQGLFSQPLHGLLRSEPVGGEDKTIAYRFFWTDPVPWAESIRAGLEGGPESDLAVRSRTVAYYYFASTAPIEVVDRLDVGDPASRLDHGYATVPGEDLRFLDGFFEGEPPQPASGTGGYRDGGSSSFTMTAAGCNGELRLRRRFDASIPGQSFDLEIDGVPFGGSDYSLGNPDRAWAEADFVLPAVGGDTLDVGVEATPESEFTEFLWELLCRTGGEPVFADGFETGDASRWSNVVR